MHSLYFIRHAAPEREGSQSDGLNLCVEFVFYSLRCFETVGLGTLFGGMVSVSLEVSNQAFVGSSRRYSELGCRQDVTWAQRIPIS